MQPMPIPARFVESSHIFLSDEVLAHKMAHLLKILRHANHKEAEDIKLIYSDTLSPHRYSDNTCVVASREGIKIDFTHACIQGWVASEIYDAEGIIEEVLHRKNLQGARYDYDIEIAYLLENEIKEFLNNMGQPASLSVEDVIYTTVVNAYELRVK